MKQNNNNNLKAKKAFKVVLLGDSSCGKTSLLSRYIKNIFSEVSSLNLCNFNLVL